ncbi:MAG: MFS transporter [Bacillota bacterium]|nr:MFS transporter [Bacillota bacterium]
MLQRLRDHYLFHAGISCFFYLAFGAFSIVLSMYCQDIGMNASQISYIVSFSPFVSIVTQPYFGYLADKWKSCKKVSILLLLLSGISMFVFAISRNFWVLLLSSGLAIGFMNAVTPLTDRIGVSSPYDFGKIRLWGSIGYALMAQVSGILYQYISPFSNYMVAILGTIIGMICVYMVSDPRIDEESTSSKKTVSLLDGMKVLVYNKKFMIFLAISFFFWGVNSTNYNYLSIFIRSLGGSASQVGTYQLCATLFEIPMILATDFLVKKVSYRAIMIFAICTSIINFVWYSTLPSVGMIIAVFVFKGFSTILFTMITVRLVIELVPDLYVSSAYGIQSMLGKGLGAMLFQLAGGVIIDSYNMTYFYLFLAIGAGISLVIAMFFKSSKANS